MPTLNLNKIGAYSVALQNERHNIAGPGKQMYFDQNEIRKELQTGEFPEEMFKCFEHQYRKCLKINSELVLVVAAFGADEKRAKVAVKHFNDPTQGRMFRFFCKTGRIEVILGEKRRASRS